MAGEYKSETLWHFDSDVHIRPGFQGLQYRVVLDTHNQRVLNLVYNRVEYLSGAKVLQGPSELSYAVNGC